MTNEAKVPIRGTLVEAGGVAEARNYVKMVWGTHLGRPSTPSTPLPRLQGRLAAHNSCGTEVSQVLQRPFAVVRLIWSFKEFYFIRF